MINRIRYMIIDKPDLNWIFITYGISFKCTFVPTLFNVELFYKGDNPLDWYPISYPKMIPV